MANWREELTEAVKTKAEREAEEASRLKQRVVEALGTAENAFDLGVGALRFVHERIGAKGQPVALEVTPDEAAPSAVRLVLGEGPAGGSPDKGGSIGLGIQIDRETAIVKVQVAEAKAREFDFAKDRHIAALDVEEYVGRRAVELVRLAQKATPW
jgi:hypothetical protein